jgi:hypothetical protein
MTKWGVVSASFMFLGIALVAASFLWSRFSDPRAHWSEEQAEELTAAGMHAHSLSHKIIHATSDQQRQQIVEQLDAAQEQHDHIAKRLDEARTRHSRPAVLMRWVGTACMVLGVSGYCVMRSASEA